MLIKILRLTSQCDLGPDKHVQSVLGPDNILTDVK